MKRLRHFCLVIVGTLAAMGVWAADLKVGVITSLSGPVSGLGVPYQKGVLAAQAFKGTVGGRKVQLSLLDDASDPATAARIARKLVAEDQVDARTPRGHRHPRQ